MKRTIFKIFLYLVIVFGIGAINSVIEPILSNSTAMLQMETDTYSKALMQLFVYFKEHSWILLVVLAIEMFCGDIKKIIKKVRENNEKDK